MGPTRIARHGFVTYGRPDGLATEDIRSIFEGHDGEIYVVTGVHSRFLHRFDGSRFTSVKPLIPGYDPSKTYFWGWGQIHFQDHAGEWWIATDRSLLRYRRVPRLEDLAHTPPLVSNLLGVYNTFRLYEDSRGDIWISSWGAPDGRHLGLSRWERSTQRLHDFTTSEGWTGSPPTAFREDRTGAMWVGQWSGGVARYRGGHFTLFTKADGFPAGGVFSIFSDHAGQLWIGTSRGGLVRVADPTSDHPHFVVYTTREGLSSNDVRAITEDHWGRIYFWTGRGVDRLEPGTGAVRHYTEADGLVRSGSDNNVAYCDRHGTLWFGLSGLSRLDPEPDQPDATPPPIRITGLRIRGAQYPISELGETNLSGVLLEPKQNAIQIDFAGLNFGVGNVLRYQYKLEGADRDWSALTELRTVNYAELRPGAYRFLVRTVNSEGVVSSSPALLAFRLLAPLWQRWWFLSLAVLLSAALVYAMYRYRWERVLELERVRTRIATDLHDDIGSSLTQIAIMSEVARQQACASDGHLGEPLARIADLSRGLVDSMSDVVWAINPRRDHLSDLAYRMRRFASDVFSARDIELGFSAPSQLTHASLGAVVRREVFLVFKESVNNIARHSKCQRVEITLEMEGSRLLLKVSDDGTGFDLTGAGDGGQASGHGLTSMEHRARSLGGSLRVVSQPGGGTCILLEVPLGGGPLLGHKESLPK